MVTPLFGVISVDGAPAEFDITTSERLRITDEWGVDIRFDNNGFKHYVALPDGSDRSPDRVIYLNGKDTISKEEFAKALAASRRMEINFSGGLRAVFDTSGFQKGCLDKGKFRFND